MGEEGWAMEPIRLRQNGRIDRIETNREIELSFFHLY